jgi:hypothetical protein
VKQTEAYNYEFTMHYSSLIIRHLQDMTSLPVLRIFCNHSRQGEQTVLRLIQSLWWQLTEKQGFISNNLRTHHLKQRPLTNEELWAAILAEFDSKPTISKAYFVIDGLDELDDRVMRWFVTSLIKLPTNCHLLLTSRDLDKIGRLLTTPHTCLKIKPYESDLKGFIHAQCHEQGSQINELISNAGERNSGLYTEIEQAILQRAGSM